MKRASLIVALAAACVIPYLPFLPLPFISDDYLQLTYSRDYISAGGFHNLLGDALYRCRTTSLVLTRGVDAVWGASPVAHRFLSLAVHFACALAVLSLGRWRRIGWRVSVTAAFVFALREGHQEAVIWSAALHDLVVTLFAVLCLLVFALALESRRTRLLWLSFALFVCALYSKESAAALPAMIFAVWWLDGRRWRAPLWLIAAMSAATVLYAAATFAAAGHHLHLNDGTFSWRAPFPLTIALSLWRMLLPWGLLAVAVVVMRDWRFALTSLAFAALALAPYGFLTYMNRVPSRHTYWAGVAIALLIGRAFADLPSRRLALVLAVAYALHNPLYLWTRKLEQYRLRAQPTEEFLQWAGQGGAPAVLDCAPYRTEVFDSAARVRLGWSRDSVHDKDSHLPARHICLGPLP